MSFSSEVKQEVAQKLPEGNEARAELSALIQMTSSLSISNKRMTILVSVENAAVARTIFRLVKDRYGCEIELFVKKKRTLRKNMVYGLRILSQATDILRDLGIYSSRGLLEKPLKKIVETDNMARAYLAGAFLASGSVNPPGKTGYHLEITASSEEHGRFLVDLMNRFRLNARMVERRGKTVVYMKAAEKIGDFLRIIEADMKLLEFENIRIGRDFTNSITRLTNIDVANEIKTQNAAARQLEDIRIIEEENKTGLLNDKLKEAVRLRKENPDSSLNELAAIYESETGKAVSKSGMKHRYVKLHEIAMQEHEERKEQN